MAQKPHKSPTSPAPVLKKIYTGRVKHEHSAWCFERGEHERASRGGLETKHGLQEREKVREEVRVGPELKDCEAGYETKNC